MTKKNIQPTESSSKSDSKQKNTDNELVKQFEEEQEKYRKLGEKIPKKGASRFVIKTFIGFFLIYSYYLTLNVISKSICNLLNKIQTSEYKKLKSI